jgi:uncharacterized protein (UPF0276 family)
VVCRNVDRAQDILRRALVIENPSSYLAFTGAEMTEWEFIAALCQRTGCGLLLDVNNIHVSAVNHGFDARLLAGVPLEQVRQIHLAGHTQGRELLIDTHDQPVPDPVWALFGTVMRKLGTDVAVMIERDDNIPPLADLLDELDVARSIARNGSPAWA